MRSFRGLPSFIFGLFAPCESFARADRRSVRFFPDVTDGPEYGRFEVSFPFFLPSLPLRRLVLGLFPGACVFFGPYLLLPPGGAVSVAFGLLLSFSGYPVSQLGA